MTWEPTIGRAAELRRAFDASFAEAPPATTAACENVLRVRLGPIGCAIAVSEISGVFADVKITPVPTTVPELLGIGACRGSLLPVYDLRAILGYGVETKPRWLVTVAAAALGLAFDDLEGQTRVSNDTVLSQGRGGPMQRYVARIAEIDGVARPIVSVHSVLEEVRIRLHAGTSRKE